MQVKIKDVDYDNWEDVVELGVEEYQKSFLASNVYSLAEAAYENACVPNAIYAGEKLVGFIMYESLEPEGLPDEYMICRFMIDKKFQRMGFGRQALKKTICIISNIPGCKKIKICYDPKNPVAKAFYSSFGFVEMGLDEDGEMIADLT